MLMKTFNSCRRNSNFLCFTNQSFHKNDFNGICAECHFFATSHSKSPSDGIGRTVKRSVFRASLQAPISSHILTAEAMDAWPWARSNIKNVTFLFVTSDQIIAHTNDQEEPYEGVKTIVGTRSHHTCVFTRSQEWNFARVQIVE